MALSLDPRVRRKLEVKGQQLVQDWLRSHKTAIKGLPERRRQIYDEIRGQALEPELRTLTLPPDLAVTKSDMSWERHVYSEDSGKFPATLNTWERAVVNEELENDTNALWFRNIPRKSWAITIPYEVSGKPAGFYPDFLFVREHGEEWVVDLLDPHHIELADAPAKALGLAKYAAKHHADFGRIELIIVRGEDDIRRIDLTDEAKRDKVLAVRTKEHLALLFEDLG